MNFPYCSPCAERVTDFTRKTRIASAVAFGASVVVGGVVFAISALPLAAALALALVIGIGGTIGAVIRMQPAQPLAPATSRGEAARIVSFKDVSRTKVYCSNAAWGDEFARANSVQAKPKSKGDGFGVAAIILGVILAPCAAAGAWYGAHPTVQVDNPTAAAINVYVDGKKALSVGPNAHESLDVGYGKHTLGWSNATATTPVNTIDVKVQVNDAHLYNPGNAGCYWVIADVYGSASTDGIKQGPQSIQEFYHFDKVDTWFAENPTSVEVSSGQSGDTRVAVVRALECVELAQHGCSLEVRQALIACEQVATTNEAIEACATQGEAACGAAPDRAPAAHGGKPTAAPPTKPASVPTSKKR